MRDRLITDLNSLRSGDDAALWAFRSLPEKNQLTAPDAQRVEEAFKAILTNFTAAPADTGADPPQHLKSKGGPKDRKRMEPIDKSALALSEPRRVRDRDHVRFVARLPCLICGRQPSDAHHLRFAQSRALGRKASDEFTVPLCRGHHREVHRGGDELAWWTSAGINPSVTARALWLETHPLPGSEKSIGDLTEIRSG